MRKISPFCPLLVMLAFLLTLSGCVDGGKAPSRKSGSYLPDSPEDVCPIKVGQKIPVLNYKTVLDKDYDIAAEMAERPTILIVYRGGW